MHLKTMKLNLKLRKTSVPETVLETEREYNKDESDDEWFDVSTIVKAKSDRNEI